MPTLRRLAIPFAGFIAIAFCSVAGLHQAGVESLAPVRWFGYLMFWTLPIFVLIAVLLLSRRRYLLSGVFLLLALYVSAHFLPLFLPKPNSHPTGERIRVLSYNVWSGNTDFPALIRLIDRVEPQLVLLQEITPSQFATLRRMIATAGDSQRPYYAHAAHLNLAIISRFPLQSLPTKGSDRVRVQPAILSLTSGPVQIYNVHFLRYHWHRRNLEIAQFIQAELDDVKLPVILAGDLNSTGETQAYQAISVRLQNSHEQAGQGFGWTFPAPGRVLPLGLRFPPLLRIDHIFASEHFRFVSSVTVNDAGGSDHLPLVAELVRRSNPSPVIEGDVRWQGH